jgi:transposase
MARGYRRVDRDQQFLLPPDMREWLPESHLVWFVVETVEQLDMSGFCERSVLGGVGRAGFDPKMLVALLVYGYAQGVRSARQVARLCEVDVAFRVICAQDAPQHCTISRFRAAHEEAFVGLFGQVLGLAAQAGLGRFGTVAVDGFKVAANASIDANRDEGWLREQARRLVAEAAAIDAAEDAEFGDARGDELPAEWSDPKSRRAKIRAALEELEQRKRAASEAAEQAEADADAAAEQRMRRIADGEKTGPGASGGRAGTWGSCAGPAAHAGGALWCGAACRSGAAAGDTAAAGPRHRRAAAEAAAAGESDRSAVAADADPEGLGAGLQRAGRGER